jgi:hypothetical protein
VANADLTSATCAATGTISAAADTPTQVISDVAGAGDVPTVSALVSAANEAVSNAANAASQDVTDRAAAVRQTLASAQSVADGAIQDAANTARVDLTDAATTVARTATNAIDTVGNVGSQVAATVSDLAAALPSAVDAALPAFNSGAPLSSPSYINARNPPSGLTDGPVASGGDSFFVAGGYQTQFFSRAADIMKLAQKFYDIEDKLEKKGKGIISWTDDDELIAAAKNVQGVADALTKLAKEIDAWSGSPNKDAITKGSKAVDYLGKFLNAMDAVRAVDQAQLAVENMEQKPNEATVEAWADSVGNLFDKAGGLIGMIPGGDALPGFMTDYWKGLFSAPKNYIGAFKTMMKAHYRAIDEVTGYSSADKQAYDLLEAKTKWEGELTGIYAGAFMQPKDQDDHTLQDFMDNHHKVGGVNLYKATLDVGRALLLSAIASEVSDTDPSKQAWTNYVGGA